MTLRIVFLSSGIPNGATVRFYNTSVNVWQSKAKVSKKIRIDQANKFDYNLAREILLEKGVKLVNINKNVIIFKSKSIFSYHNFHIFAYVDSGELTIQDLEKRKAQLSYIVISKRIPRLTILMFLTMLIMFQSLILSILFTLINSLLAYQLTYNKHEKLLKKLIEECAIK